MSTQEANPLNTYLRTRVLTASPQELRLLLLDGAIKFARQGRDAMTRKDFEGIYNGVSQCRNIVTELLTSVREDADPALAERIRSVYSFLFRELIDVGMARDIARLDRVIELLEYERETWALVLEKLGREQAAAPAASRVEAAPAARASLSVQA